MPSAMRDIFYFGILLEYLWVKKMIIIINQIYLLNFYWLNQI